MMGRLSVRDRLLLSNVVEAFATYLSLIHIYSEEIKGFFTSHMV